MGYRAQIILSVLVTQLCPALSDPMNCGPPGFCFLWIFQARILEWVCHSLLQGIYPTLGFNLGLKWILYPLNHQRNPSLSTIAAFRGTRNYSRFSGPWPLLKCSRSHNMSHDGGKWPTSSYSKDSRAASLALNFLFSLPTWGFSFFSFFLNISDIKYRLYITPHLFMPVEEWSLLGPFLIFWK